MKNDNGWNEELNSIKYSEDMNEELPKANDKKICKYCKSKIDAKAKICPNCKKKQGKSKLLIAIIVVVVIAIIASVSGGNDSGNNDK